MLLKYMRDGWSRKHVIVNMIDLQRYVSWSNGWRENYNPFDNNLIVTFKEQNMREDPKHKNNKKNVLRVTKNST